MSATKEQNDKGLDQQFMNDFVDMEIFEEDDVFNCVEFNDENNNDIFNNNVMEIVDGEIEIIDYALKKSVCYDLQTINACDSKENKEETEIDKKIPIKYKEFHDSYQVIVELQISSSDSDAFDEIVIGALIPKGYVILSFNEKSNNNNDLIWYDSIHNLLLKNSKKYEKLATERIQSQLASISTAKTD